MTRQPGPELTIDPVLALRPETQQMLNLLLDADRRHFQTYVKIVDNKASPADCVEEAEAFKDLCDAVAAARSYAASDPELMEAERLVVSQLYAIGESSSELSAKFVRGEVARTKIRGDWNQRRIELLGHADMASIAVGWPHRGEDVIANIAGRAVRAQYLGSFTTMNTSHRVVLSPHTYKSRDPSATALITWDTTIGNNWGPADPSGSIGLKLASSPDAPLAVPYPRFPTRAQVGLEELNDGLFRNVTTRPTRQAPSMTLQGIPTRRPEIDIGDGLTLF